MPLFAEGDLNNFWTALVTAAVSIIGAGGVVKIVQLLVQRSTTEAQYKKLLQQERRANTRYRDKLERAEAHADTIRRKYEDLMVKYMKLQTKGLDGEDEEPDKNGEQESKT